MIARHMLTHPQFDPVAIAIGPLQIHWYGLTYLVAFGLFLFLAVLNTVLLYTLSFESWLAAKLWLFMPLSFLFTFTQIPMLLKHGLALDKDADTEVLENPPHE